MSDAGERLRRGLALHGEGRLAEAGTIYRELLAQTPDNADLWRFVGLAARRRAGAAAGGAAAGGAAAGGNAAEAAARRAVALAPDGADNYGLLALARRDEGPGGRDGAIANLLRAVRLAPDHVEALVILAEVYRDAERPRLAAAALRMALVSRPDHRDARLALTLVLLAGEEVEVKAAEAVLRGSLALEPARAEALCNLGLSLQLQGRLDEAEVALRRLLRLDLEDAKGIALLVRLRLLAGDLVESADLATRLLRLAPGDFEARHIHERTRRYQEVALTAKDPSAPRGLAVRGPFRDTSGYAWMVRRFARGMVEAGTPIHLIDLAVDFVPTLAQDQRDRLLEGLDRPVAAKSLLTFAIPTVAEPVPGLLPVNFSMFEARTVPRQWLNYARRLPHIIVPTLSSRDAWADAGFPVERLRLCPLGVDPTPPDAVTPLDIRDTLGRRLADYPIRVLNVSDLVDRKNLGGLLRVWLTSTRPDDGAILVLKLGKGRGDRDQLAGPFLERVARSVNRRLDQAAPILLVQGVLSDAMMGSLFAACTHYWSMSHGEGWDLPMTQAGAAGLRLIAPRHSAYTTYLDDEIATLLPCRPIPASAPYQGLEWWAPDEAAAAEALGVALAGRDAPRRNPAEKLAAEFGWPAATARLLAALREIGAL